MSHNQIVSMGHIIAPFGIKGWVKIKVDTQTHDSLGQYPEVFLKIKDVWTKFKLESFFVRDEIFHAKLSGVDDRDASFALKGAVVGIDRNQLPKLEDDEYYWNDLVGLDVYNQQQDYLGKVVSLMQTGANDVLVVELEGKQRLIPFIQQYVVNVDLGAKQILVDWGLDY